MSRPSGLLYAVDETPPRTIMVISALQHVAVNSVTLVFPLIIAREAGLPLGQLVDFVSLSMLAMGISTILLCARWRFAGCGYLCPAGFSQIYVGPSLFAVHLGGLPLAFGMTALAGILQFAIAPLLHRLRALLPTEIAGLVIAIVGLSLAIYGIQFMLGITSQHEVRPIYLVISGFTLVTMVVLNIWTKGYTKLFSVLIGVVAGYAASAFAGVLDISGVIPEGGLAILHLPNIANFGWRFDATLLAPFAVAALATTLRTMGDVSNAQRLNDKDWIRPDFGSLTGGVAANGLATLLSGLMGSSGLNSNSSSVGLSSAMGITSRSVGFATGITFVLFSIVPIASIGFAAMPVPVMGASLFFTSAFVFTSGLQMITTRLLDARKAPLLLAHQQVDHCRRQITRPALHRHRIAAQTAQRRDPPVAVDQHQTGPVRILHHHTRNQLPAPLQRCLQLSRRPGIGHPRRRIAQFQPMQIEFVADDVHAKSLADSTPAPHHVLSLQSAARSRAICVRSCNHCDSHRPRVHLCNLPAGRRHQTVNP